VLTPYARNWERIYLGFLKANENTSTESWSATIDGELVAKQLCQDHPDWSPALMSLVKHTPNGTVNDWLLLFRDPEPTWVSTLGRVTQCGDSAHPFLPTSANGATQAMEDAATLGTVLRLGFDAKCTIKESLQVYNSFRSVFARFVWTRAGSLTL
jgi:2-polyprenyl-6-methoxyphenol hydroxylase-like FAD-dependent oxidoreductase